MLKNVSWSFILSLFSCWVLCLMTILTSLSLPVELLRNFSVIEYFLTEGIMSNRRNLINSLNSSSDPITSIAILCTFASNLYLSYLREILLVVLLIHLSPFFKGEVNIEEWWENISTSVSGSEVDSEPPELECIQPTLIDDIHEEDENNTVQRQEERDWYVYDPTFGVIPKETRDLWAEQEIASEERKNKLLLQRNRRKTKTPDIRNKRQLSNSKTVGSVVSSGIEEEVIGRKNGRNGQDGFNENDFIEMKGKNENGLIGGIINNEEDNGGKKDILRKINDSNINKSQEVEDEAIHF